AFEKLYANQSPRPAQFTVRYTSQNVNNIALAMSLLGTLVFWAGLALLLAQRVGHRQAGAVLAAGAVTVFATLGFFAASPLPAAALSAALASALLLYRAVQRYRASRNLPVPGSGI
ncbi:MAG: hypothetical protein OEN20_03305, partial [Gammaproteobacteria bacterium]|nr:hypothetical protein [Gammaproteobacteria bacterium]